MGSHSLLQGIFPTQGLNPGLLHCRQILYCLSYQGNNSKNLVKKKKSLLFPFAGTTYSFAFVSEPKIRKYFNVFVNVLKIFSYPLISTHQKKKTYCILHSKLLPPEGDLAISIIMINSTLLNKNLRDK